MTGKWTFAMVVLRSRSGPCERGYVKRAISLPRRHGKCLDRSHQKPHLSPRSICEQESLPTLMNQKRTDTTPTPALANLWVLLVQNDGELSAQDADGRVPMLARAGNDQKYLLVFKNAARARQFLTTQDVNGAEPRMVVRGN